MKNTLALAALVAAFACSTATAASLSYTKTGDAYAVYLAGEADNGNFNTVYFSAVPNGSAVFTNNTGGLLAGSPRAAGDAFTYPNRLLNADPVDFPGGLNLSQLGLINTPQKLEFTVANLAGSINTSQEPGGRLFLGNLNIPGGPANYARVTTQIINAQGNLVGPELQALVPIPEPASVGLAGMALVGLAGLRRRLS